MCKGPETKGIYGKLGETVTRSQDEKVIGERVIRVCRSQRSWMIFKDFDYILRSEKH